MAEITLYFGIAAVGYILSNQLIKKRGIGLGLTGITAKIQTVSIFLLVLTMGVRVGANEEIVENLSKLGLYAFGITVFTVVFSFLFLFLGRIIMGMDRKANVIRGYFGSELNASKANMNAESALNNAGLSSDFQGDGGSSNSGNKMAFMIVITVSIGIVAGFYSIDAIGDKTELFNYVTGTIIKIGLCILLFFVGFDMGVEGTFFSDIKKAGLRVLLVPVFLAIGSLVGAGVFSIISPLNLNESLAIGAGFSWYSLAPAIILDKGYVVAASISFLHNIMRELLSLLFIPLAASKIGYIECLGLPACCSSDVTLPIIAKSTNSNMVVYSFVNGIGLAFMVPLLVTLFI